MAKKSDIAKFEKKQKYSVRNINRCVSCGRSRGYLRKFALCRICFREKALAGEVPGVKKVSW
jgi:small subunit ribosomal protein S14